MSFPLDILPSIVKIFLKTRDVKVSWFGYMGSILYHYSILPMDVFNILPMGLEVLEKNGIGIC